MARTKAWWARLTPDERLLVHRMERVKAHEARELQRQWRQYVPPTECPLCGQPITLRMTIACEACRDRYYAAIRKAQGVGDDSGIE